ncbi:MAG: DnaJ domain-containing protein [Anaerolineales bacterium]|nr:DnaJ domain-containing protein [Anaerolineales bacterium]
MSPKSYYDLLGLTDDATPEEIRRAYHDAALKFHPDVSSDPKATELFMHIQEAYNTLSDLKERKKYDERLANESDAPVLVKTLYSRSDLTIFDEPQLIYALIGFKASPKYASRPNPPINVNLTIDCSTSMQGLRMDTVKTAAIELVRQLKPDDVISIVTFSDRAEVLIPAGQKPGHSTVETKIRMMQARGGTEIFQGLEAGYSEVRRNLSKSLINHIILLTDGRTYGDEDKCLALADRAAMQGVRITGLGMGTDWNDIFLDELTTRTGGSSYYISRVSDFHSFLKDKFQGLNEIFAERVILNLETGPGVKLNDVFRLSPDVTSLPAKLSIRLGSIPRTSKLSILLEFIVDPIPADTKRVVLASGELQLLLPSNPSTNYKIPFLLSRMAGGSPSTELPPRPIFQALSQINLYHIQERARQEVAEGKVQRASLRLQRLATQLISMGEHELAQTALVEAERIQQTHMLSAEGEKRIKYGTRALLLPAQTEKED